MATKNSNIKIILNGNAEDLIRVLKQTEGAIDSSSEKVDEFSKRGSLGLKLLSGSLVGVAGSALAAGGVIAGAGLAFVGMAALAVSSSAGVKDAVGGMLNDIKNEAKDAAAPLAGDFINATEKIDGAIAGLKPQLKEAFAAVKPDINLTADAITNLATRAMPGLVTAAKASEPVFKGLVSFSRQAGDGLSQFFTGISKGAPGAGTALGSLGNIVETLLGFTGNLVGKLANEGGPVLITIAGEVRQLSGVVTGLASGALPLLSAGLNSGLGLIGTFLTLIAPFSKQLGAIGGIATDVFGAFRLGGMAATGISKVGTALGNGSKQAGSYVSSLAGFAGAGTIVEKSMSGIANGISSAAKALPLLGAGFELADLGAQKLFGDSTDLANQLLAGGDATNKATMQIAKNSATTQLLDNNLGGIGEGIANLFIPTMKDVEKNMTAAQIAQVNYNQAVNQYGQYSPQAIDAAKKMNDANKDGNVTLKASQSLLAGYGADINNAAASGSQMATVIQTLTDNTTALDARIQALQTDLKILSDGGFEQADDFAAKFNKTLEDGTQKIKSDKGALLDRSGALDLNTEKGRELLTMLEQGRDAMAGQAEAEINNGMSIDEVTAKAEKQRQAFVRSMEQMGLTSKQANNLADNYGLIPSRVVTEIKDPGATQTKNDVIGVLNQLHKVPTNTAVRVNALTSQAVSQLSSLGFKVTHMKDGSFTIVANTGSARHATQAFIDAYQGRTIFIPIKGVVSPVTGRAILGPYHATGGIDYFANGGLTPMSSIAQMVSPNSMRVVGDRSDVPEAYIPEINSTRSKSIWNKVGSDMNWSNGRGGVAVMQGGDTYSIQVVINGSKLTTDQLSTEIVTAIDTKLKRLQKRSGRS